MNKLSSLIITERSFYKKVLSLSAPLVFQSLLMVAVNMVNTLMMGRFGEVQMTAVSQSAQIFFIYNTLSYGVSLPSTVLIAQYWGRGEREALRTVAAICLRLSLLLGLVFSCIVLLFPGFLMGIMSSDPAVVETGTSYLRITALSMLFYGLSNAVYCSGRGTGRVKIVMMGNCVYFAVNLLLNYLLIFGVAGFPELGVNGAAVGLLVARGLEMALALYWFLVHNTDIGFKLGHLLLRSRQLVRDYLAVMRDIIAHEIIWSLGTSAGQIILGQLSTSAVSAYNIAFVLQQFLCALLNGFGSGCMTIEGNVIGSGDLERAKKTARSLMLAGTGLALLVSFVMLAFGGAFVSLYNISPETAGYARAMMPIMTAVLFFSGWEVIGLVNLLRSAGDGRTGFLTDVVTMWLLAIPLGLLAAFRWGLSPVGVILIMKIDMPIKSLVGLIKVLRMKWIKNLTHD